MAKVWIVDDDQSIRWVFEKTLLREKIDFRLFSSAEEASGALSKEKPSVVVSDIRMSGNSGLDLLNEINEKFPKVPTIIMTAHSDLDSAVAAFQRGAFEYLAKPFDIDAAVELIQRAIKKSDEHASNTDNVTNPNGLLGQAKSMQEVFRTIGRLSQTDATVLITGESGTGKELIAQALHQHSQRSNKPFVAINTASIPKELLESELFGHERGSFTGAQATRKGRFEQAAGGTLFLDEIGDMPAELQTRLLRVLSDGHYYRVGGHDPLKANVRVLAATHQNLEQRVAEGLFREDLFHRLNVIRVKVPPLRERNEDIPLLADFFLERNAIKLNAQRKSFTEEALIYLQTKSWQGNVRQLENLCHWVTIMAPGASVDISDLPKDFKHEMDKTTDLKEGWHQLLAREVDQLLRKGNTGLYEGLTQTFEKALISRALTFTAGRKIEAANLLGIGRNTISRKMSELNLSIDKKQLQIRK
ncbi:MAG: nitrogen regulation protein NR(I) [Proteobacteria bacterium]|nr:nitrogen regulation protein NR(I) [Pseudomonadota bacterium]MDA0862541.1 nitrogen regulation protein NR(I) [Pseudomonadota bacterium]